MESKRNAGIPGSKRTTITRFELARLSFCNSKNLPLAVNDNGVRKEWVGIGWIEVGKPRGNEVLVIDVPRNLTGVSTLSN